MMRHFVALLISLMALSCSRADRTDAVVKVDPGCIVSRDYIGNGVQWDPYALDYGTGRVELSESDWAKLYSRLDFMKPAFIRLMIGTRSYVRDGVITEDIGQLARILDYCQSRNVSVMFGDWGGGLVDAKSGKIDSELIGNLSALVYNLVIDRGYDCIKYCNIINEPNGYWSSADGNYDLWISAVKCFSNALEALGIGDKLLIAGPDAAIWTDREVSWVSRFAGDFPVGSSLYDIHTYPSKCTVNSGKYSEIIRAYRQAAPSSSRMVMGEIGFKFVEEADSSYLAGNERRIAAKPHASRTDSQMYVYDYMYGTDMADALFQTVNEGYSGCVAWMLDDAMHYNESKDKLKIWGFWNILGDEIFGPEEEEVRPWFYAWSLLCRFFPAGSDCLKVNVEGNVKAASAVRGGKMTIAVVNVSGEKVSVSIDPGKDIRNATEYVYGQGLFKVKDDCEMLPASTGIDLKAGKCVRMEMEPESLVVISEME